MPAVTRRESKRKEASEKSGGSIPLTTLTSLPTEVLALIATHIDLKDALSLARISRHANHAAQLRFWRDLDVSITGGSLSESKATTIAESRLADQHKVAVAARLDVLLARGSLGRYRAVESLKLAPRPGCTNGLVPLLRSVSPKLRSLTFVGAAPELGWKDYLPADHATLDFPLLESGICFPALTHVRIYQQSVQYAEFLPVLCNSSPNLISLNVDLSQKPIPSPNDTLLDRFPDFERETAIRQLRVSFGYGEHVGCTWLQPMHPDILPDHPILRLFRACPQTEQLSVGYHATFDQSWDMFDELLEAMAEWRRLRDVYWQSWSGGLRSLGEHDTVYEVFSSVRRCILEPHHPANIFRDLPWGENIRHVHFFTGKRSDPEPDEVYPNIPPHLLARLSVAQHMTPIYSDNIRKSPFLRHLTFTSSMATESYSSFDCFDELDDCREIGKSDGYIDSYRHGGSELVQARIFLEWVEVNDHLDGDESTDRYPPTGTSVTCEYDATEGDRTRSFEPLPSAVWQTFTDYEGRVVPMDVLDRMQEVQGLSDAEWLQRGVEVGDEAWKVLTDWYDGLTESGVAAAGS